MNGQTNTASLTPNTPTNTDRFEWTCVSWYNKISNAVTNKSCHFLGVAVASFAGFFTFIPSLVVDLGYATKRLYDRQIKTPPTSLRVQVQTTDSKSVDTSKLSAAAGVHVDHLRGNVWYSPEGPNFPVRPFSSVEPRSYDDHTLAESSKIISSGT